MAANNISLNDVDRTINLTFAASDQGRVDALGDLHLVLGAEAQLLIRSLELSTQRLGPTHPNTLLIAEQIEISNGFLLGVDQEYGRAIIAGVSVAETNWGLYGFLRDLGGNGLPNLTVALFDSGKPGAIWVEGLGRACTDATGFFKLEAGVIRDYTFAPVYVHVLSAQGATLYLGETPFTPQAGELNYIELVIGTQSLDCPAPPALPPPPPETVDLKITAADSPDPVRPDADLTYVLTVANHSQAEAKDVKVIDTLPAHTTFTSAASGGGFTYTHSSGVVTCKIPSLAAGATATITIVVKVSQDVTPGTLLSNTAKVSATASDSDPTNDTAVTTTTVVSAADLSITMTGTPDTVVAGQKLTYTLQVTNQVGASSAQSVTVTAGVPPNTTFVSAEVIVGTGWGTPTTPAVGGTGNVGFSKTQVAPGESATFKIVVNVNQNAPASTIISNTAKVISATTDTDAANNTATVTTNVTSLPPSADLSITMTDTPDPVVAGQNITYMLRVTNQVGALAAQSVTVTAGVPPNTTFFSAEVMSGTGWGTPTTPAVGGTGNVGFSKTQVAPGETVSLQIVVKVNADTTVASISNTATVASPSDKNAANNTAAVTTNVTSLPPSADLQIAKTDDPNPVAAGRDVTYTLSVYNAGPSSAQSVTVTDPVPPNTTFVSAAVTSGKGWPPPATPAVGGTGNVVFSKGLMAAGDGATFRIVVNVNQNTPASATIINTATVASPTIDPNTDNTAIARTALKLPSADLAIAKIVSIAPGGIITYLLTLTNNGPNVAEDVKLTDPIPANTTFVSAVVTSGTGWIPATPPVGGSGNVVFSNASVAAGETASFQIVVKLNPNSPVTTINNMATVTSSTTDPDSKHNSAEAIANIQQPITRRALVVFTEVNKAGDHTPLQGSPQPSVTFTDNVPNSGDLEAAFSAPPSGFKMKQFKGVTMAAVAGAVDADMPARLKAVVSALQKAGGPATLTTGTVVLSGGDQTTLASRKISIADIDGLIFVELAVG